jgi:uncharacterized protein YndB with AHSA1/START domain
MPIKKDEMGKRWVEMNLVLPGTPEQVWDAIATGDGYKAWFSDASIEERVGGALQFTFGSEVISNGVVSAWEPPYRFGYVEHNWSPGAPPVATDITVTRRASGSCVVRMTHSLFASSDEWDDQVEGFENGWPAFFEVLRIYLTHFAGMKAASFMAMTSIQGEHRAVWSRLVNELGLGAAHVGERCTFSHPEKLTAIVERVQQDQSARAITLRLETPVPGVMIIASRGTGAAINASVTAFLYDTDAASIAGKSDARWREWIEARSCQI